MAPYIYSPLSTSSDEIRLITLKPGSWDDPVHVSVNHVGLIALPEPETERLSVKELRATLPHGKTAHETPDGRYFFGDNKYFAKTWEHPNSTIAKAKYAPKDTERPLAAVQYEALSYLWGEEVDENRTIYVYDMSSEQDRTTSDMQMTELSIRSNLFEALQHLRKEDIERRLWIDAICINQEDTDERAREVQRMARIYGLAQRTVVWLGSEAATTKLSFQTLRLWASYLLKDVHGLRCFCDPDGPFGAGKWQEELWPAISNTESKLLGAVNETLGRAYFRRLWIRQEIKMSSQRALVVCGPETIPWTDIATIVAAVQAIKDPLFDVNNVYRVHSIEASDNCDVYALANAVGRQCHDPRDRIYAVLALISPHLAKKIKPDYSLKPEEVYRRVCLEHISITSRLELSFGFHSNREQRTSWVPDFWSPTETVASSPYYLASECSRAVVELIEPNVLEVLGIEVSIVGSMSDPTPRTTEKASDALVAWYKMGAEHYASKSANQQTAFDEVFCDIITQGAINYKGQETLPWPSINEVRDLVKQCRTQAASETPSHITFTGPLAGCLWNIWQMLFVCLDSGLLGLAPRVTLPGDVICVILGAYPPVVLRPLGNGQYRVIGNAYVPGLMFGEALLGSLPPNIRSVQNLDLQGGHTFHYHDTETGAAAQDPRKGPVPHPWTQLPYQRERADPHIFRKFRNTVTGEVINSDPRLLPDALEARGVILRKFQLV